MTILKYTTFLAFFLQFSSAVATPAGCVMTTRTRNLLGVTDFNTRTFSYMGRQPTSLVYGYFENESVITTAAVFYLTVTECQNSQNTQANGKSRAGITQFSLRPVDDRTLLINDPGVVEEHEEYQITYEIFDGPSYKEVFLHHAMGDEDEFYRKFEEQQKRIEANSAVK